MILLSIFVPSTIKAMEEYKKFERRMPKCLECGDQIKYGRKDKKFCCEDCKTRHYNNLARSGRVYKRRVMQMLAKNYELLDGLVKAGEESVDLADIVSLGFTPEMVTYCNRSHRNFEFACYDIKYRMSENRLYSISKIRNVSLPLQFVLKETY